MLCDDVFTALVFDLVLKAIKVHEIFEIFGIFECFFLFERMFFHDLSVWWKISSSGIGLFKTHDLLAKCLFRATIFFALNPLNVQNIFAYRFHGKPFNRAYSMEQYGIDLSVISN